jgi:hypothetical protein
MNKKIAQAWDDDGWWWWGMKSNDDFFLFLCSVSEAKIIHIKNIKEIVESAAQKKKKWKNSLEDLNLSTYTYCIYKYINFLYKHIVLIFLYTQHTNNIMIHFILLRNKFIYFQIRTDDSSWDYDGVHREMKNAFNDKIIWSKMNEARFISMICRIFFSRCFSLSWMYFYFVIESSASTYLKSLLFLVHETINIPPFLQRSNSHFS